VFVVFEISTIPVEPLALIVGGDCNVDQSGCKILSVLSFVAFSPFHFFCGCLLFSGTAVEASALTVVVKDVGLWR
jgi:hypothetical protein